MARHRSANVATTSDGNGGKEAGATSRKINVIGAIRRAVLFLGMSHSGYRESNVVKQNNARLGGVYAIINAQQTKAMMKKVSTPETLEKLVLTWKVSETQSKRLIAFLYGELKNERTRLLVFRLAEAYARMEKHGLNIERVVLSGESFGEELFSKEQKTTPAFIDFGDFVKLADIFPDATGRIRHLLVSACSCGYPKRLAQFRDVYKHLVTIMGYASKGPSGEWACDDIKYWENRTRAEGTTRLHPVPDRFKDGTRFVVGTWSEVDKFQGTLRPLGELTKEVREKEPEFIRILMGPDEPSDDPMRGVAHDYYRLLAELMGRIDYEKVATPKEYARYSTHFQQSMRLRYWPQVWKAFWKQHQEVLAAGYVAAGLDVPSDIFWRSILSRNIEELSEAIQQADRPESARAKMRAALLLLRKLQDLDPDYVPKEWL